MSAWIAAKRARARIADQAFQVSVFINLTNVCLFFKKLVPISFSAMHQTKQKTKNNKPQSSEDKTCDFLLFEYNFLKNFFSVMPETDKYTVPSQNVSGIFLFVTAYLSCAHCCGCGCGNKHFSFSTPGFNMPISKNAHSTIPERFKHGQ